MDVYKSFHDFLRLLYVFLEPLFSILAWFIDQGYLLGCSLIQWVKVRITKQAPTRHKRVKSSDLKCGRFLGESCSGIIYEATWSRGRNISLLARKAFPAVPADVFEYEAARLVELDHPNIVKVLGWTVDRRSCSLVMDRMKYDLFSVVQKRKEAMRNGVKVKLSSTVPFPLREAVHIMLQIAEGMKYVHDQRLAHGDLKPNNVLLDSESGLMLVKVTDFGLTETKKRSTTLVSHQARCLQILKWKAPELFEDLLGPSTEDSENTWTEMFPDLEVVKTSHALSSGSAESKMQLADVYSFALTCSSILGAQVPHDSNLGLFELRNEISSGARPHLPSKCPKVLASLISECWDTIPSRRPAFIDICKEMRTVEWDLIRNEGSSSNSQEMEVEPIAQVGEAIDIIDSVHKLIDNTTTWNKRQCQRILQRFTDIRERFQRFYIRDRFQSMVWDRTRRRVDGQITGERKGQCTDRTDKREAFEELNEELDTVEAKLGFQNLEEDVELQQLRDSWRS